MLSNKTENLKVADDDKASSRLTHLLSSMIDKLKMKIDKTEKDLGTTLHRLDLE